MTRSSTPPGEPATPLPSWMRWLGAGLTALVAVLFVVLLVQVREQGQRLQALQNKVQTLENNNDLERTNALEEQLRSTVQRLQNLETLDKAIQELSREQEALGQQLRSQRTDLRPLPPADPSRQPTVPALPPSQE